jgi:hypothetical protein
MTPQRRYEVFVEMAKLYMELAEDIRQQIAPAPNPAPPPVAVGYSALVVGDDGKGMGWVIKEPGVER